MTSHQPLGAERRYRRGRSAAIAVSTLAALSGTPYSAMVEIADRCNEACVHCYQVQGKKGELDTEQWKSIFKELAAMGVVFLTISGGEPTLRKDFLELVRYARELRFAVKIYSNALNITASLAAELGRLAVQEVQISLYSHRAEVHDAVTRVPGSFGKVVAATQHLRAAGVHVLLKSPLMLSNSDAFREYVEFASGLGADYALDPNLNPREDGSLAPIALAIGKQDYLRVRRDPAFGGSSTSPAPTARATAKRSPCGACRGNVHVEPNGELRPCTLWNIPTGDALLGLEQAWKNDTAATAIRALTWDSLPSCRTCDLREYCSRCFADAESFVGNALAPYAKACRTARWQYELRQGAEPEIDSSNGWCDTAPLGPFRAAGEHRFLVEHVAQPDPQQARSLDRSWFDASDTPAAPIRSKPSEQLVQIRRRPAGTLTPSITKPSDQ